MPEQESALVTYDPEAQKRWEELAKIIKANAQNRRRQRTPQSKIKSRSGGGEKTYKYVDRADYQIWLDDNFPGWTIEDYKVWTEKSITPAQTVPILFCASFMLVVIDGGLAKRRIPCVGTASVSEKELGRDNATLLKQKFNSATTECYKMGCNWLGAFFDLRADDEEREKASKPPTDEQFEKFKLVLSKIPMEYKDETTKAWKKITSATADAFIKILEDKVNKLSPKEQL